MEKWIEKITSYGDVTVTSKKNDRVLHIEATTYLNAPLCRINSVIDIVKNISCDTEDGSFFSFKPTENGMLSYYAVDTPEDEEEATNSAVAVLKAIRQMVEVLTYGK